MGVKPPEQSRNWFVAPLEADHDATSTLGSFDTHLMSSKPKLLTTTQTVAFLIAFVVVMSLWIQVLLRLTREGVIVLQPAVLSDYIMILVLFVAVPLIVIALFVALAAYVALNRAKSS